MKGQSSQRCEERSKGVLVKFLNGYWDHPIFWGQPFTEVRQGKSKIGQLFCLR